MRIMTCKHCQERFELKPNHRGYANVCEACGNPPAPPIPVESPRRPVQSVRKPRPMTAAQFDRAFRRDILALLKLSVILAGKKVN